MTDMKCPNIKIYKCSDGFVTDNAQVAKSHEANIKSNKLICPFCNGELVGTIGHPICRNQNCVVCDDPMPQDLLEELIRTRKALEIAVGAIDEILVLDSGKFIQEPAEMWKIAKSAKDKITALEQKDVK